MIKKLNFGGLMFKPAVPKKKRPKSSFSKLTDLIYCLCVEEEPNIFKAHVNIKGNREIPDILVIPFTEDSYDLKGKTKVFTVKKDKQGKRICIHRDKIRSIVYPGNSEIYTPFNNNYVYSGYVVKQEEHHYFKVSDIYEHVNYCNYLLTGEKPTNIRTV